MSFRKLEMMSIPIISNGWRIAINKELIILILVVPRITRILNPNAKTVPNKMELKNRSIWKTWPTAVPIMLTIPARVIEINAKNIECFIFMLIPLSESTHFWSVEPVMIAGNPKTTKPNAPPYRKFSNPLPMLTGCTKNRIEPMMKLMMIISNNELFASGKVLIHFDNPATLLILDINNQTLFFKLVF